MRLPLTGLPALPERYGRRVTIRVLAPGQQPPPYEVGIVWCRSKAEVDSVEQSLLQYGLRVTREDT